MRLVLRVILGTISYFIVDKIHVVSSLDRREADGVNIHGIKILCWFQKKASDAASFLEGSNSFLLDMEFACLFDPFIQSGGNIFHQQDHLY